MSELLAGEYAMRALEDYVNESRAAGQPSGSAYQKSLDILDELKASLGMASDETSRRAAASIAIQTLSDCAMLAFDESRDDIHMMFVKHVWNAVAMKHGAKTQQNQLSPAQG